MTTDPNERPPGTSMEGMIWNAHHTLEQALDPRLLAGIPKSHFQQCAGICIMTLVELGFVFSGSVGTGILLAKTSSKRNADNDAIRITWSNPVACALSSVGFGAVLGAASKDVIIFIRHNNALQSFLAGDEGGLKVGGHANLTVGDMGRSFEGALSTDDPGAPACYNIAFSKGMFLSLELSGAKIKPRTAINEGFYRCGKDLATPQHIVEGTQVRIPHRRQTLYPEVLEQLDLLCNGKRRTWTEDIRQERVNAARVDANEAADEIHREAEKHEVVQVDAKVEAAKEAATAQEET